MDLIDMFARNPSGGHQPDIMPGQAQLADVIGAQVADVMAGQLDLVVNDNAAAAAWFDNFGDDDQGLIFKYICRSDLKTGEALHLHNPFTRKMTTKFQQVLKSQPLAKTLGSTFPSVCKMKILRV